MTKTRERRGAPRVVAKLAMQIAGMDGEASVLTTESINLSAEGLQFQSKIALAPLTKVALTLLLPPFGRRLRRERLVQCQGVIVRAAEIERPRQKRKFELACCFTEISEQDKALVEQYVVWRSMRRIATPRADDVAATNKRRSAAR
ncbi:MAG: PilZ domain-containing protein [Candidatus Eisenbacteria bacterium]|uniref:PilZ domain-containing protein n=1 Tax=Eiseniibacteriota bacterium TaxID=2212470 RepID=A0A538SPC3_UNCEI|nr:MAG: PilZ domain-containing protein [Candidatus Eisenbacteria bacterium]TMQ62250.1 MAG: PilZ domain-containing protein [Candidatus Eisenbacteria bacterium]